MAAMSKRKMTRAKIADAYHQIESMRAQCPRMDLYKKPLPIIKQNKIEGTPILKLAMVQR